MLSFKNKVCQPSLFSDEFLNLQNKKELFLNSLKGSKLKYKRYNKSPLRYPGGKSLAVGLIIEHFPNNLKRVISPFLGGGSVEIACACELDLEVKAFDIFDILVNFWQILIKNPQNLCNELLKLEPNKATYKIIKDELKQHWDKKISLEPLILARDYYFNFNLSYGPGFLGWMSSIYEDNAKFIKQVIKMSELNLSNLSVECASFESVFERYKDDFFYLDPPYFLEGDSKMFRGIYPQRNFPIHHNGFKHELLCELLKSHKGKFILSYNDCEWVRNAYKEYKILEPKWQYTMGQGETRIGKNRLNRGDNHNIKNSHELLIIKE